MLASGNGVTVRRYWSLDYPDAGDATAIDQRPESRIVEELGEPLEDACRSRLRADVPVGSYLSGGRDSSLVTALARRQVGGRLATFSVGFEPKDYDEAEAQATMVAALRTDHRTIVCSNADIGEAMPAVIGAAERPILRTIRRPRRSRPFSLAAATSDRTTRGRTATSSKKG